MAMVLAIVHLLALPLGSVGVFLRLKELSALKPSHKLNGVYFADNLWGVAAIVWISTGLLRAFGGFEKGSAYYLQSPWFHIKLFLVVTILVLEIYPMVTLVRWRIQKKDSINFDEMPIISRMKTISRIEFFVVLGIVVFAVAMSRGGFY